MSARDFVARRGTSLALVVLVLVVDTAAQWTISHTLAGGRLTGRVVVDVSSLAITGYVLRGSLLAGMVACWLFERKLALLRLVIVANAIATLALVIHTTLLVTVLAGLSAHDASQLIMDAALMAVSNMLIFSVWYWVVDPPGVHGQPREDQPWAFLFPQRGGDLPNYGHWQPRYPDYLFVAFTTTFAFSPTDALPLTRTAKMLMMLQATISVVTLTGIAGSAISILAGGGSGS